MRSCSLCNKGSKVGRNRSHAQNRTPRLFKANIHKVTLTMAEGKISGAFCSGCLSKLKNEIAAAKAVAK